MEMRPYFVIGDAFANAGVGALAASVVTWLGLASWPMAAGMVAGMALGMVIGLVAALTVLSLLFGAMEIFVPCMLSGMLAGMAGAMGMPADFPPAAGGALVGVAVLACVYLANALLHGARAISE